MTQASTPKLYAEIEARLGESLAAFVADRRGAEASWRGIAVEVFDRTQIKVSHEALRVWHQGIAPVADTSDEQRAEQKRAHDQAVPSPLPDAEAARLREMVARPHGGSAA